MRKRTFLIALLASCFFAALGFVGVSSIQASAEAAPETAAEAAHEEVSAETITWLQNSFVMDYGASVRVGEEVKDANGAGTGTYKNYGIRFSVTAGDEEAQTAFANLANSDAITGVLIAPATSLKTVMTSSGIADKNAILTAQTVFEEGLFDFAAVGTAWTNKTIYNLSSTIKDNALFGAIINLNTTNFLQKYTGVAYVGIPQTYNDDGSIATYTYYFAKHASTDSNGNAVIDPISSEETGNDVENNTRCMYYIAQKAVESEDATAAELKTSYLDAFAAAHSSIVNSTQLKYTVVHHYFDLDGNEANTRTVTAGATLGEYGIGASNALTAEALEGTYDNGTENDASDDLVFEKDVAKTGLLDRGYLYAGSMTYLHVYYSVTLLQQQNQETTNDMIYNTMRNDTEKYFGSTIKISGSEQDPALESANEGINAWFGQSEISFTVDFINEVKAQGFTRIYIQSAELYIGALSSLFAGGNVVVDTIQVSGCVTAVLDANVVGYTVKTDTSWFQQVATVTFTGITIELPEETPTEGLTLAACVGNSEISGEWTLSGVIFG